MNVRRALAAVLVLGAAAGCSAGRTYSQEDLRELSARADSTHALAVASLSSAFGLAAGSRQVAPGTGHFQLCKGSADQVGYLVDSHLDITPTSAASARQAITAALDEAGLEVDGSIGSEPLENQFRGVEEELTVDVTTSGSDGDIVSLAIATSSPCLKTTESVASTLDGERPHDVR